MNKFRIITKRMVAMWAARSILDANRRSKATAKGHKHVVGSVFKSINHSGISPAEYRHDHYSMRNKRLYKKARKKK